MITTVTTTTVTTVTVIAAMGLAAVVAGAIIGTLLAFLAVKELASSTGAPVPTAVGRHLSVPIFPMLMVFVAIVVIKIAEVLA